MKNLISRKACIKYGKGTSINLKLTNKPGSFHSSSVIETILGNCQKLKPTPPNTIECRNFKKFGETLLFHD